MGLAEHERLAALEESMRKVREDLAALRKDTARLLALAQACRGFWFALRLGAAIVGLAATIYEAVRIGTKH